MGEEGGGESGEERKNGVEKNERTNGRVKRGSSAYLMDCSHDR